MWDFSQEVTSENVDTVPEQFRGFYVEGQGDDAGKFSIDKNVNALTEAIVGLNGSLANSRQEATKALADLKGWTALGEDPAKVKTAMDGTASELQTALAQNSSFDPEALTKEVEGRFTGQIEELTASQSQLKGALKHSLVNSAAMESLAKHKGTPALIMPHIQNAVRMVTDESGNYGVQVIDLNGQERFSATSGKRMTVDELVLEYKAHPELGMAFKSDLKGGDGGGQGGQRRAIHGSDVGNLSSNDKIAMGLQNQ